jgi:hypothetical protein
MGIFCRRTRGTDFKAGFSFSNTDA